jgi:hypothetical protein
MTIITRWNTIIFMTTIRMQQSSLGVAGPECWTRNGTTPSQCIAERAPQRVQRASFVHFMLLCLIPTALLLIVVVTVFGEEEPMWK